MKPTSVVASMFPRSSTPSQRRLPPYEPRASPSAPALEQGRPAAAAITETPAAWAFGDYPTFAAIELQVCGMAVELSDDSMMLVKLPSKVIVITGVLRNAQKIKIELRPRNGTPGRELATLQACAETSTLFILVERSDAAVTDTLGGSAKHLLIDPIDPLNPVFGVALTIERANFANAVKAISSSNWKHSYVE